VSKSRLKLKKQAGIILAIDALIMLSVMTFSLMLWLDYEKLKRERDVAGVVGNQLSEYQSSVSRFVSFNQYGGTLVSPSPLHQFLIDNGHDSEENGLVFNGTNWLKIDDDGVCPDGLQGTGDYTANQSFLDCRFSDTTRHRQSYTTTVWWDALENRTRAKTVLPAYSPTGEPNYRLTALAALRAASSTYGSSHSDDVQSSIVFDEDSEQIIMEANVNVATSAWVKTDGTVAMGADFNVGGYDIVNVNNGTFSGTLEAQALTVLGDSSIGDTQDDTLTVNSTTTFNSPTEINSALTVESIIVDVDGILVSLGDVDIAEGSLNVQDGINILGEGDLNILDGNIVLNNATPTLSMNNVNGETLAEISSNTAQKVDVTFGTDVNGDLVDGQLVVKGDIYSDNVKRSTSQAVYDVSIVANGSTVTKPVCPATKTPQVFLGATSFARDGTIKPIGAISTYADDNGANWSVYLEILDEDGVHGGRTGAAVSFPRVSIMAVSKCT